LATRLTNVQPQVREKFVEIAVQSGQRAALRDAGHVVWTNEATTAPQIIAPVVTAESALEGANSSLQYPPRKPLRLRR
jgi:hypothetical protein